MATDFAVSRKQRVYVIKEDVIGTLKHPAASDFIRPAGDAIISQGPEFSDSLEKQDTLDILDRFQNAMPAGTFSIPLYIRCGTTLGQQPQGGPLFETLQGSINAATYCSVGYSGGSAHFATTGDKIKWNGPRGGEFPKRGIIRIGSEDIRYKINTTSRSRADASVATGSFSSLDRGYNSTTAAGVYATTACQLMSVYYKQATETPSMSVWVESDHFVQGLSGCVSQQGVLPLSNEAGVLLTFTGGGMQMVWAGKGEMARKAAAASRGSLKVDDADLYSTGVRIWNETKNDHSPTGADGYKITSVTSSTNIIVLATAPAVSWATDDVVRGYLPSGTLASGDVLEGKDITVTIDNVSTVFRSTDLTISAPKEYVIDEVGQTYPDKYLENVREITFTMNLYFRDTDAKYFTEGYAGGSEVEVNIGFGDTAGSRMWLLMPKVKLTIPSITFESPAVPISIPMRALGTYGEDSLEWRFE